MLVALQKKNRKEEKSKHNGLAQQSVFGPGLLFLKGL
jgi:hypothetical protein